MNRTETRQALKDEIHADEISARAARFGCPSMLGDALARLAAKTRECNALRLERDALRNELRECMAVLMIGSAKHDALERGPTTAQHIPEGSANGNPDCGSVDLVDARLGGRAGQGVGGKVERQPGQPACPLIRV